MSGQIISDTVQNQKDAELFFGVVTDLIELGIANQYKFPEEFMELYKELKDFILE